MGLSNEEIESRKQDIIDFADIGDHLYQPVKTYSSGMFARLAFACAINVNPDILIVDEVLSVGDMAFQLKCFKKFEEFKEQGKTIIFVTHSVADVVRNCDRAIIIDSGKKIFDGDVKEGVEKYKKIIVGINVKEEDLSKKDIDNVENLDSKKDSIKKFDKKKRIDVISDNENWKENFNQNPNLIEYGNKKAEVIDYGIFDEDGKPEYIINNDKYVVLKSKIKFNDDVKDPIFTMTVKDFKGLDICGTNTLIEKIITGNYKKGDVVVVSFKQILSLTPGCYTLSFSCTHFDNTGKLEALNRKYDALLVEVSSNKECVGLLKLDSKIEVKKIN